jgi:hypothetical protein
VTRARDRYEGRSRQDPYDENGRGLLLLTELARDWGVHRQGSAYELTASADRTTEVSKPALSQ